MGLSHSVGQVSKRSPSKEGSGERVSTAKPVVDGDGSNRRLERSVVSVDSCLRKAVSQNNAEFLVKGFRAHGGVHDSVALCRVAPFYGVKSVVLSCSATIKQPSRSLDLVSPVVYFQEDLNVGVVSDYLNAHQLAFASLVHDVQNASITDGGKKNVRLTDSDNSLVFSDLGRGLLGIVRNVPQKNEWLVHLSPLTS